MSERKARLDKSVIDMVYPVGAIYMSVNSTNPASLFGGTWEQIKDKFLLSAGDSYAAGSTGGEASHTLTANEMPRHSHTNTSHLEWTNDVISGPFAIPWNQTTNIKYDDNSVTGPTGGGQPHNNMPPYLTVYMWKRTA